MSVSGITNASISIATPTDATVDARADPLAGISIISTSIPGHNLPVTLGGGTYASDLTVTNTGTVASSPFGEIYSPAMDAVAGGVTLTNAGYVGGFHAQGDAVITNTGIITSLGDAADIAGRASIVNFGDIFGLRGIQIDSGLIVNYGVISSKDGVQGVYANHGLTYVAEQGGFSAGPVTDAAGDGILLIAPGAYVPFNYHGFSQFSFAPGTGAKLTGELPELATGQTIEGFATGDTLVLKAFAASSASFVGGIGLVLTGQYLNDIVTATLDLTGSFSSSDFLITTNTIDLTTEIALCFRAGTRIATIDGPVAVEQLAIGDFVQTRDAGPQRIKWIGRRHYDAPESDSAFIRPVLLRRGALADNVPAADLFVSPGHGICIDGKLVQAWRLLNGETILQPRGAGAVDYVHIELETHACMLAENCPTESYFDERPRAGFDNGDEFFRLHGDAAPSGPRCLPLLQDGFELEALRIRFATRAGIAPVPFGPPGRLRGFVDVAGPRTVEGWAQDEGLPETPVALRIIVGEREAGLVLANRYRADLRAAGLGSGCHGFCVPLPAGAFGPVAVLRADDGLELPLTEAAHAA